nr:MAG TPA: hypothetical protein [Caudoviricetes sp.]DAN39034.1 MAG TPA: hypothetical protein [Caudoviricetes sp.]
MIIMIGINLMMHFLYPKNIGYHSVWTRWH